MKKINIGLDIGISSVGWSILDAESFEIIKHGVRLFPFLEDAKTRTKLENENRRNARSMRRQVNRKRNLKKDFIKFLNNQKWIDINIPYDNRDNKFLYEFVDNYINVARKETILELRKSGQSQKLKKNELILLLYWYLSSRGFKYEVIGDEEKELEELKKKYSINTALPIDIQWKIFNEKGYYRTNENRMFSSKMYEREIKNLLSISTISADFINEYLSLFNRQRSYEEGPLGNEIFEKIKNKNQKNQILSNKYNRFTIDENGSIKINDNMWESSIGKCEYDGNLRAPKNSFSAELFNLLNDLNNISVNRFKLDINDKKEILKISLSNLTNANKVIKYIKNKFKLESDEEISGFRRDKNKKKILTPLKTWHKINKVFDLTKNTQIFTFAEIIKNNFNNKAVKLLDEITVQISKSKEVEKRFNYIIENVEGINNYKNEFIHSLSRINESFSETHSFSISFIHKLLPELWNDNLNQMQIIYKNGINKKINKNTSNKIYIPTNWIDGEFFVASPTTKRAIRQSLKVLNKIIKLHKNLKIENIVIEMARDLNGKQSKDSENKLQKFLEQRKKEVSNIIGDTLGNYLNKNICKKGKGSLRGVTTKVWLYEQQKGCDAYTGEKLDIDKVILNPSYSDIDHIIPYSLCHDDSMNNKVLTTAQNNSKKGQKQPFQFLGKEKLNKMFSKWQEWYIEKSKERIGFISPKKLKYLMDLTDYSKPENTLDFIGRNIVDTRYATKELLATLKEFIGNIKDDNHSLKNTKIKTVNGRMTNFIRKMIEKDFVLERPMGIEDGSFDEKGKKIRIWNGHHAEDATIVVYAALKNSNLNKMIEKVISNPFMSENDKKIFAKEKLSKTKEVDIEKIINFEAIKNNLNKNKETLLFSYMINKKNTIQLFNETLYSGRYLKLDGDSKEKLYAFKKVPLCKMLPKTAKDIFEDNKQKVWTHMNDPKTFEVIKQIYLNHKTEKVAFPQELFDGKERLKLSIESKKGVVDKFIKNITLVGAQKNENEVIFIDDHYKLTKNHNSKKVSFKESMKWTRIFIYKEDNKNDLIFINALNSKMIEGKIIYNKALNNLINSKEGIFLHRGSIIKDLNDKLWKVVGGEKKSKKLELKPIWRQKIDSDSRRFTINSKLKGWEVVEIDEIGNIFCKKFKF